MTMKEPAKGFRIEPRWPVALAILAVILLVVLLPERVVLFPAWFPYVVGIALILPIAAVGLSAEKARWLRVERTIMLFFIAVTKPDWLFPQTGAPEDAPPDWRPTVVDYLFLGFSTATAFSPTDALPLTSRAKMLMMLESTISLATIVIVASRAINILGN